jgi:hypothetical protein
VFTRPVRTAPKGGSAPFPMATKRPERKGYQGSAQVCPRSSWDKTSCHGACEPRRAHSPLRPPLPSRVYETTLERLLRRFGGGADGRLAVSVCRPQGGDWRGQEGAVGGTSDERDRETKYVFPWWGTRAPSRKRCLSARSLCKTLCFRCRSDTFTVSLSNRRDTHDRRSGANERRRR